MMYFLDLFFVLGYLGMRRMFKYMHDNNYTVFMHIRGIIGWCEFAFILLWMYVIPDHTFSEGMVSFCMCMLTKIAFQYLTKSGNYN